MKKLFLILAFSLLTAACSYDKNPAVAGGGFLEGKIETYTGASAIGTVEGVEISTIPESKTALSLPDGKYYLDDVPGGDYILKLTKDGYYRSLNPISISSGNVEYKAFTILPLDSTNTSPTTPAGPFPSDDGIAVTSTFKLFWDCSDPDTNQLYFDVYFSESYPPTECIAEDIRDTFFPVSDLEDDKKYYWRVHVRDFYGAEILGDIWSFKIKLIK